MEKTIIFDISQPRFLALLCPVSSFSGHPRVEQDLSISRQCPYDEQSVQASRGYPTLHLRINRVHPRANLGIFTFTFTISLRSCRQGHLQSKLAVLVRRRFTLAVMFRVHLSVERLIRIPLYFPLSSNISRPGFFIDSTCGCRSYVLRVNDEVFQMCITCVIHMAHVK